MEEGGGEDSGPCILLVAFSCSLGLVHSAGQNIDLQKWSKVPFGAAILLKEFLRDKGEGFQLQTYIHVGVRNINRKEHLRVTEVPAGT